MEGMEERGFASILAAKLQGLVKGVELTDKEKALMAKVLGIIREEEDKLLVKEDDS